MYCVAQHVFFCAILLLVFCYILANSLDIVVVIEGCSELLIPGNVCAFGNDLEKAFFTFKFLTYQQLQQTIS